jgi:hypothetical protein
MKAGRNILGGLDTVGELFRFFWTQRAYWLIPFVAVLLLVGLLLLAGQATGVAPFIYTIF